MKGQGCSLTAFCLTGGATAGYCTGDREKLPHPGVQVRTLAVCVQETEALNQIKVVSGYLDHFYILEYFNHSTLNISVYTNFQKETVITK